MQVHTTWTSNIRDALIAAGIADGNVERDRDAPTRRVDFPICLIAVVDDKAQADGDARSGFPRFQHTTELVVAYQDEADNGPALRQKLYTACEAILAKMLTDLAWGGVDGDGIELLEGISRIDTAYNLPPEGEAVLGAVEIKLHLLHRTAWPAVVTDDLEEIGISTAIGGEDTSTVEGIVTVPTE